MNKIFSPFTSNERKKSYVDDDKKKNANKKVVMAEDFLWDIDSLNASNFEIGIKFVKKCIAWLKLKNAHNYEGIFRKAGEVERLEVLQKEISAKVNSNADFSFGDNEDVHVVATILKRYLRGMKEPLLTFDQYDAFIASDNFSDNEMRFSSIRFALSLIPTINHTMLFEVLFYFNEVSKHEEVNMMSSRNLAIVLAPNILRSEGNKSPIQILTDSAHANSIVETLIKDTSHIFGSDDLKPEAAAKFRQTMRDIYHVTQRHGEKVLKKLKEESHLSPEQFDEKLKECVEKVKNGEIDSELLFGASGMKKATKATPSRLAIPDFDAVERPTSEEKASPSLSPHKEANDRPTSEKRAVPKSRENKLREDKGVVRHETIKPVDRRGRKYHTIGDVEHSSHDGMLPLKHSFDPLRLFSYFVDEGNREASPSPSPEPSTRVDLTAVRAFIILCQIILF